MAPTNAIGWTVIGVYDEDGQTFAEHMNVPDYHEAMRLVAEQHKGDDLQILGTIRGSHMLLAACEDSGKSAYACDLAADEEDDDEQV